MIQLIALDLDGTLLNADGTIAEKTKHEMKRLSDQGRILAIATGRPLDRTVEFLTANQLRPEEDFPQVLIVEERDVFFLQERSYQPWASWNAPRLQEELALLPVANQIAHAIGDAEKIPFFINNRVMQERRGYVEIHFLDADTARQVFERFAQALRPHGLQPVRNNRLIALRSAQVGKGATLLQVIDRMGIAPQDVLAIGDSQNDMDMLTRDFVVATTANADPEVKDIVRQKKGRVASLCRSLGVAEVLAQLN